MSYADQSRLGFMVALAGAASMAALQALLDPPPLLLQQAALAVLAFGVQTASPSLSLRMLDLFPRARGSAASVQSCVSIAIGAVVFGVLSPSISGSLLTLAVGSLCTAVIAFALWQCAQYAEARARLA